MAQVLSRQAGLFWGVLQGMGRMLGHLAINPSFMVSL